MKRKILIDTLKKDSSLFILFFATAFANLAVFLLYRIISEPFLYAAIISFVFLASIILYDFLHNLKRANEIKNARLSVESGNNTLPDAEYYEDSEYKAIIEHLIKRINEIEYLYSEEKRDEEDWYTLWVHQIKTPIAVLKLKINESDKEIASELFRIEEYADMALNYIRLGSGQNDLVIKEYSLDNLIRETLRKYAPQFIAKKTALKYIGTDKKVITDRKWLSCILEQLISNAVKYTDSGTVSVDVSGDTLTVSDTGIGISEEDLPRIFEKGYTGLNGRADTKSTGLGLYLSSKASKLIGIKITAESTYGSGSKFSLTFPKNIN